MEANHIFLGACVAYLIIWFVCVTSVHMLAYINLGICELSATIYDMLVNSMVYQDFHVDVYGNIVLIK